MAESTFEHQVLVAARLNGWRSAHFRPARVRRGERETWRTAVAGDGRGFPDLVLLRGPRLIIAELKSARGQVDQMYQQPWLDAWLAIPGAEVYVWRPADWHALVAALA